MPRGYFGKSLPDLRMPKPERWPACAGFRAEEPVMSGKISIQEAHRRAETQAAEQIRRNGAGNCYVSPEDYDPVLEFQLRGS
jgi:hypothetical protein